MGSGVWSPSTYQTRASQRGGQDAFVYSRGASGVHPTLNPYGLEVRESRDNDEHPDTNSIIVGLDVSGSMGAVVRAIYKDLPQLLGLLLGRQYVPHPQIMFAAFSNGSCDEVPVQVGQFESDNRMDMNLENMILGGNLAGGCDVRESAELLIYLAARHTSIDCWEKRQQKGFLFLITDEMGYDAIKSDEIKRIFARDIKSNIPLNKMIEEAGERYHIFVLIPMTTESGKNPQTTEFWKGYLDSQHVIQLANPDDVSETIALIIGMTARTIRLEDGLEHLRSSGASKSTLDAMKQALDLLDSGAVKGGGGILGWLGGDDSGKGTKRL